jgi:hypothetical protein
MKRLLESVTAAFEEGSIVTKLLRGRLNTLCMNYALEAIENKAGYW